MFTVAIVEGAVKMISAVGGRGKLRRRTFGEWKVVLLSSSSSNFTALSPSPISIPDIKAFFIARLFLLSELK